MTTHACRVCRTPLTRSFVDLGLSPLSNSYVKSEARDRGEMFHPLHAFVCTNCFLVQLTQFESPEAIFSDYAYFSSFSSGWLRHAEAYAEAMMARLRLGPRSHVVEVASNDGYLLQYFIARGVPVLGVEPAANVAAVARGKGIPTEVVFFGEATARQLRASGPAADLMIANNVLAHVPDILDFVAGFAVLLAPEGVATFEFPHLLRQIAGLQFDQIYHEHFSYLSLLVVQDVMARCGLRVFDVEELPTHGGSLRVFVTHGGAGHAATARLARVLDDERAARLDSLDGYTGFAEATRAVRFAALEFFIAASRAGKRVCAYGAAAKGNTFLNYVGIGADLIEAVADRSPHKQGSLLPGSRIPVVAPEALTALRPDYLLILPWNLRSEIEREMEHIRSWGGRFVTAIPTIAVF
ncbi:MAG: class I SAM-dependent methyltransferase [Nevskia sp.]|nr:class I SAM-dependent methyltransferase [Nevskia sp.]